MTAFNDNNITDAGRCDINLYTPKPVPFQQTPFTPRANFPTRTPKTRHKNPCKIEIEPTHYLHCLMVIFSTNTDRKVKQTDSLSRSTVTHEF
jgi:hypothetical protein